MVYPPVEICLEYRVKRSGRVQGTEFRGPTRGYRIGIPRKGLEYRGTAITKNGIHSWRRVQEVGYRVYGTYHEL